MSKFEYKRDYFFFQSLWRCTFSISSLWRILPPVIRDGFENYFEAPSIGLQITRLYKKERKTCFFLGILYIAARFLWTLIRMFFKFLMPFTYIITCKMFKEWLRELSRRPKIPHKRVASDHHSDPFYINEYD